MLEKLREVLAALKEAKARNSLTRLEAARLILKELDSKRFETEMFCVEYEDILEGMESLSNMDTCIQAISWVVRCLEKFHTEEEGNS